VSPASPGDSLAEAVQKLDELHKSLEHADYEAFWTTMESDDVYADLIADCVGFETHIRTCIARSLEQSMREVERRLVQQWVHLEGGLLDEWMKSSTNWQSQGDTITIPLNRDNEVKQIVKRENIKFDQLQKVLRRAYQAA